MDFHEQLIRVDRTVNMLKDKIVMSYSERYNSPIIDLYESLKDFQDMIYFIGTDREYQRMVDVFGLQGIHHYPVQDALDTAIAINSARLYIGNLTGNAAIAEMIKAPRIICHQDFKLIQQGDRRMITQGVCNVVPCGGHCIAVHNTPQLKGFVGMIMDK